MMGRGKKHDETAWYFVEIIRGKANITKYQMTPEGQGPILARHVVADGECDCRGFMFRRECRHLEMLLGIMPHAVRLPHKIAWSIGQDFAKWLIRHYREEKKQKVRIWVEHIQNFGGITQVCLRALNRDVARRTYAVTQSHHIVISTIWNDFDPDWLQGVLGRKYNEVVEKVESLGTLVVTDSMEVAPDCEEDYQAVLTTDVLPGDQAAVLGREERGGDGAG